MLRELTRADIARIVELEAELFGLDAWSAATFEAELARSDRAWWGIERGGELAAYAGILIAPQAELLSIAVAPAHQGSGLGRELLAQMMRLATAGGARELFLEVRIDNEIARALYASAGFSEIGIRRRYYRGGIDAVAMVARLVAPSIGPIGADAIT